MASAAAVASAASFWLNSVFIWTLYLASKLQAKSNCSRAGISSSTTASVRMLLQSGAYGFGDQPFAGGRRIRFLIAALVLESQGVEQAGPNRPARRGGSAEE